MKLKQKWNVSGSYGYSYYFLIKTKSQQLFVEKSEFLHL